MKKRIYSYPTMIYLLLTFFLTGCSQSALKPPASTEVFDEATALTATPDSLSDAGNTNSLCLTPTADGTSVTQNEDAVIDYSNASHGYVMVNYLGTCPKVKLRVIGPDSIVYTYDLHGNGYETFPLSSGNGDYEIIVYENIADTSYATCLYGQISVQLINEFTPFLYPNQYVNFTPDSDTVAKGNELASFATSDIEIISNIYNYIISSITYDYEKASHPPTGYTTDVDEILHSGTGICLDYAAVMASMLRSQQIPTRLEIGYAQDAYHAWISVYTEETGWLNHIIEFNGSCWTLIDPTFGATTKDSILKKFIGDGTNYVRQKIY